MKRIRPHAFHFGVAGSSGDANCAALRQGLSLIAVSSPENPPRSSSTVYMQEFMGIIAVRSECARSALSADGELYAETDGFFPLDVAMYTARRCPPLRFRVRAEIAFPSTARFGCRWSDDEHGPISRLTTNARGAGTRAERRGQ